MMSRRAIGTLWLALVWLLAGGPAWAQAIERLADVRDWSAFRYAEGDGSVCYMASQPKKDEGDYQTRGEIYAIITHRPAENRVAEVSIVAGYTYKEESAVEVKIGSKSWELFTDGANAWAPTPEEDIALVKAMKGGSSMIVKGTSSRDTETTDTYSLLGFSKAYAAISKACGL
jgi:hypothetical protein